MTTAITFHDYTGDGSDLTFDYTFPTYAQSEVKVDINGTESAFNQLEEAYVSGWNPTAEP